MTVIIHTIAELRQALAGRPVAFVPTMGALHEGHLSLVRRAREHADEVVVSVFVNPMQFAAGEDFDRYPRTLAADVALLEAEGVQWVFAPSAGEMYPDPPHTTTPTTVHAGPIAEQFEGAARPGHFNGMLTVVLKLLNIVQPHVAVFGQKDAQQLALVRQMVLDFNLPVTIVAAPISREPDGLARSSRNRYLTPEQRAAAPALFRALQATAAALTAGEPADAALARGRAVIDAEPELQIEYFDLVDDSSFVPSASGTLLITVVRAGATRLLDNLTMRSLSGAG
ncbi:MAG: pantoate--beta-alanine ligase [Microbacteriaceae bacterium]